MTSWSEALLVVLRVLLAAGVVFTLVPVAAWLERKGAAYIQDRPGPNRAALFGMFRLGGLSHVVADVVKLIAKEDIVPQSANRFYFNLAPLLVGMIPLLTFAIIPMADDLRLGDLVSPWSVLRLDGGLLWFFAITSLAVYGVVFAGWASANKYGLLGAVRAVAQLLSYEIPMALAVLGVVLAFGTVQPNEIVQMQGELIGGLVPKWGILLQPVAAVVFLVCALAEINRVPFDLAEGDAELVAGYHTEYSGMRFGLFFMGEYMALVVSGALAVTLFLGGWQIPYFPTERLLSEVATLLPIALALGATAAGWLGSLAYRHYLDYTKGRWGDLRDYEPLVFAALFFTGALLQLVLAGAAWGGHLPTWVPPAFATVVQLGAFTFKVLVFCWVFVWVRWTLPRFRFDQLLRLGWRGLLPLSLFNLLGTGIVASFSLQESAFTGPQNLALVIAGVAMGALTIWGLRRSLPKKKAV